ncbi:MAG: UvrD-helicase domain-containing protein [Segniliparus sp.]|uniref:UvrD-helicase domain-containing protein n=1 Tax=Segniliparus sp. TaxID=2804064 RepID=UPI003F31B8CB
MIDPSQWNPARGFDPEPNAKTAVTMLDENVVVAAGPGSGKTELLAQRADFLLRTGKCPYPRRILALCFKVDAARNLRERVRSRCGDRLAARFDSFTFDAFAKRLIDNFRPALTGYNAIDPDYRIDPDHRVGHKQIRFKDLVPLALEIIETNNYARLGARQTYSHVFLDEFQDCTQDQYKLVQTLFGQTTAVMTAVGDTKQRIMAWAGALEGVMQTFADDFSARSLPIYKNHRSDPRLRRMQNRMIARMDPSAASPTEDLTGDKGIIDVLGFPTEHDEASVIGGMVEEWLGEGVAPGEIAILVRQQPHLIAAELGQELTCRGIAFRNEQQSQDLAAEPAAALVLNFLRVIADNRQPDAYAELTRAVNRSDTSEDRAARFDSQLARLLRNARTTAQGAGFNRSDPAAWRPLVDEFLRLVSRPMLVALSSWYRQGAELDHKIEQAFGFFSRELAVDGDAAQALKRLSGTDAIRFLTIHKCKGLEFEKVVVLGVEEQLFWDKKDPTEVMSEFFVAISRAKHHLVLTHTRHRDRPQGHTKPWQETREAHRKLLRFAQE